jgi:outer membrane biosynthesis protein TonB
VRLRKREPAATAKKSEDAHRTWLADEDSFDRRSVIRLGAWCLAAVSAVVMAMLVDQSGFRMRRDEVVSVDLKRQTAAVQQLGQQTLSEARQLASAIETLNSDRDRLYARVSTLEQGLDSVTGSIGRQAAATVKPAPAPTESAPEPKAPQSIPAADTKPAVAPPAPQVSKQPAPAPETPAVAPVEVAAASPIAEPAATPVPRTSFGIDLGIAPSIEGLRAVWKQISTAHPALASLTPLIVIKEKPGAGLQLRLVAGPLRDATSAAQICAALPPGRMCEPATFDGQRLAMSNDSALVGAPAPAAAPPKPLVKRKPKPKPPADPAASTPPATSPGRTSSLMP